MGASAAAARLASPKGFRCEEEGRNSSPGPELTCGTPRSKRGVMATSLDDPKGDQTTLLKARWRGGSRLNFRPEAQEEPPCLPLSTGLGNKVCVGGE